MTPFATTMLVCVVLSFGWAVYATAAEGPVVAALAWMGMLVFLVAFFFAVAGAGR